MRMPFGKYRGCHVDEVPANYLEWAVKQQGLDESLRRCIKDRLRRVACVRVEGPIAWPRDWDRLAAEWRAFKDAYHRTARESLTAAYRETAERYRPDRGGSPEAMAAVNELHDRFHELIERWAATST
jgi:hypothetical protein